MNVNVRGRTGDLVVSKLRTKIIINIAMGANVGKSKDNYGRAKNCVRRRKTNGPCI